MPPNTNALLTNATDPNTGGVGGAVLTTEMTPLLASRLVFHTSGADSGGKLFAARGGRGVARSGDAEGAFFSILDPPADAGPLWL